MTGRVVVFAKVSSAFGDDDTFFFYMGLFLWKSMHLKKRRSRRKIQSTARRLCEYKTKT